MKRNKTTIIILLLLLVGMVILPFILINFRSGRRKKEASPLQAWVMKKTTSSSKEAQQIEGVTSRIDEATAEGA